MMRREKGDIKLLNSIDEIPWVSSRPSTKPKGDGKSDKTVSLYVEYEEKHIRSIIKNAGGKWNSTEKVWILPYRKAVEFGLEKRIVS